MSTRVPGCTRGVRLKSKAPLGYASADKKGSMRYKRRRFNIRSAYLVRRSHKWRGGDAA